MAKNVFISDMHVGDPDFTPEREASLRRFLGEYVDDTVDALYIVGDGFELLQSTWGHIMEHDGLVHDLNEAGEKTRVYVMPGNHDIDIAEVPGFSSAFPRFRVIRPQMKSIVIREKVGEETTPKVAKRTLSSGRLIHPYGLDVHVGHGYEFDHYFSGNPHRYDAAIRAASIIEKVFGNEADDKLLEFFEGIFAHDENRGETAEYLLKGSSKELHLAARDIAEYEVKGRGIAKRKEPLDAVVFGHTHRPLLWTVYDEVLEEEGRIPAVYANTGCWVENRNGGGSDFVSIHDNGYVESLSWDEFSKNGDRGTMYPLASLTGTSSVPL